MSEPVVSVEQGRLRGKTGLDINKKTFFCFQGIPYAEPPVGDLRFKAPVPAKPWTGIRDATSEGSESLSKHMIFFHPVGSEDCLSLNVYTPQLPNGNNTAPKAVMVWIHGGGFTAGSSKTEVYGPEFLIKDDIVLVSINYRLGILGFLSLEDTSLGVPGNNGFKDAVLALKWVQKNICQFGGDPNNVTIFGESAGSSLCHFLILSPMAKGLFHRAILQSGSVLNPWSFGQRSAIQITQALGHDSKDEKDALEFLKKVPAERFLEAQDVIKDSFLIDKYRPIGPVIEKPNPDAFITEDPLKIMLSGNYNKVPIIIGFTNKEGMLLDIIQSRDNNKCIYRMRNFEKNIPRAYNIPKGTEASRNFAKKIEEFYYGSSTGPEDDVECYYSLTSDQYFIRGIHLTVKALLETLDSPIYFYKFCVESTLNMFKIVSKITSPGVCHADDLGYIFKNLITPEIDPHSLEGISVHRMTKLWTNFAKTGNPNSQEKDPLIDVEWPAVSQNLECLDIGEKLTIVNNPEAHRMEFWDKISETYNSKL